MEAPSQAIESTQLLDAQLRECFGRVVYSHKTHEKCADIYHTRLSRVKLVQIGLSAITTGGLVALFAVDSLFAKISATLCSTVLFGLNAYMKQHDLGELSAKHSSAASKLWDLRESYLSLLTDFKAGVITLKEATQQRDKLQRALLAVYQAAPRTLDEAYRLSQKSLQINEELTFNDGEIDRFLPARLRHSRESKNKTIEPQGG
jgi:hypothetical protein